MNFRRVADNILRTPLANRSLAGAGRCESLRGSGDQVLTRRRLLERTAGGLGKLALAWLIQNNAAKAAEEVSPPHGLHPRQPHFPGKAKSVIWLFMAGGPSQLDLMDPKPNLIKYHGQPIPVKVHHRRLSGPTIVMGSPFKFTRRGQSGLEFSELLPSLTTVADQLAVIRSVTTDRIDHDTAQLMFTSGRNTSGFPSVGSWVSYGLGTENHNLPAYVTLVDSRPIIRARAWTSGWLPPIFQGTTMNSNGAPIFDGVRPEDVSPEQQRDFLQLVGRLNRRHLEAHPGEMDLESRIANYELAARMQVAALDCADLSAESESTKRLYGLDQDSTRDYGKRCLLARRLVEKGVRFVSVVNGDWDHHSKIVEGLKKNCQRTDQPIAALLKDLKQRGMLDSTLVVWGGEFGRLPVAEKGDGRDHNPYGFSLWMAGGGVKGGITIGATDDFGYQAVEQKLTISDIHATILHALGLDFQKLSYDYEGRSETLTGVNPAKVVGELFA